MRRWKPLAVRRILASAATAARVDGAAPTAWTLDATSDIFTGSWRQRPADCLACHAAARTDYILEGFGVYASTKGDLAARVGEGDPGRTPYMAAPRVRI